MKHGGNVWEAGSPSGWLDFSANLRPEGTPDWAMRAMRAALCNARYYPDRAMRVRAWRPMRACPRHVSCPRRAVWPPLTCAWRCIRGACARKCRRLASTLSAPPPITGSTLFGTAASHPAIC